VIVQRTGIEPTRRQLMALERENAQWPTALRPIPREQWPDGARMTAAPSAAWRSRDYLVVLYEERPGVQRLTISSTHVAGRDWVDGLTWDTLQRLKGEAGFADRYAVELFPPDAEVVNVANLRHLWLLDAPPTYGWKRA